MNRIITIGAAGLLVAILLLYMCSYQVRSTEVAVEKTRGKFTAADVITEAGWQWKLPWPLQSVVKTDKRVDRVAEALHVLWSEWAVFMQTNWSIPSRRWWSKKARMRYADLQLAHRDFYRAQARRIIEEIDK